MDEKVRENRLRRAAKRQDLALHKSRRRDPRATDYGCYKLVDIYTNAVVIGAGRHGRISASLNEIEKFLNR